MNSKTKVWNTTLYLRLSKDDGDKEESNSIQGQRQLLQDYVSRCADLHVCAIRIDDGFTGSNFDRPAFHAMLNDIKTGQTDCVIVKDLSRFGRNYLDAGEYIEKIFPFLGVRFIAVNDHYDSAHGHAETDGLMIPFKNLINEAYCRDISTKIRSQLEIKRKKGDFIGSFAVYGYVKNPANKNQLLIDEYAADVVRTIFQRKLEGVSPLDIAGRLNADGILSPLEYKRSRGLKCYTPFQSGGKAMWSAVAVLRILKNPVYIGTLVQGKVTTPSYKVKKQVQRPQEEWAVVENRHAPVVSREDFVRVQEILKLDTRTSPGQEQVYLFSGLASCGECGESMTRKTVPSGKKKYIYYVCSRNKSQKGCFTHSIGAVVLEAAVFFALKQCMGSTLAPETVLRIADTAALTAERCRKIQRLLEKKQEEIRRFQKLCASLYAHMAEGLLDQQEYLELKQSYTEQYEAANRQAVNFKRQMESLAKQDGAHLQWAKAFKKYHHLPDLNRFSVVSLIEKIVIYRGRRIEIKCRWRDEFAAQAKLEQNVKEEG